MHGLVKRLLTVTAYALPAVLAVSAATPAHSGDAGAAKGWSDDGVARIAPQLSETLGSIFAGAELCGMPEEAKAVAAKHSEHLDRLAREKPAMDIGFLQRSFTETSEAYRGNPGHDCGDVSRQNIRRNLPGVFASIDAFHDALGQDTLAAGR